MVRRTSRSGAMVERQKVVVVVVVLLLVALNADLDNLFEHSRILPTNRGETGGRVKDGDGLNSLETNTNARDMTRRRDIKLHEAAYDLVIGHRWPLVRLGQRPIGRMQEDSILKQVEFKLARLEEGGEHVCLQAGAGALLRCQ